MADGYIDHDEVAIYGDYAVRMMRKIAAPLLPAFTPAIEYAAAELESATEHFKVLQAGAHDTSSSVRAGTRAKGTALKSALGLLGSFSKHLSAQPAGSVDRKTYFTKDGTAGGVGKNPSAVLLAVIHIAAQLQKDTCTLPEKERYLGELQKARDALSPSLEHAQNAKTDRAAVTPELEAARKAWLALYTAAKRAVESALRFTGKLHMMPSVFYDLAVPASTKVTSAPAEPPAEPDTLTQDA